MQRLDSKGIWICIGLYVAVRFLAHQSSNHEPMHYP